MTPTSESHQFGFENSSDLSRVLQELRQIDQARLVEAEEAISPLELELVTIASETTQLAQQEIDRRKQEIELLRARINHYDQVLSSGDVDKLFGLLQRAFTSMSSSEATTENTVAIEPELVTYALTILGLAHNNGLEGENRPTYLRWANRLLRLVRKTDATGHFSPFSEQFLSNK